jgi:uncharacterized HAD superfamily protein
MNKLELSIGVDIDSTINRAHFYDIIHGRELCKEFNHKCEEHLDECDVKKMFNFSDELYKIYMIRYFPWNCKFNEVEIGASEALRILSRKGYRIVIITARDDKYNKPGIPYTGDRMVRDTLDWLEENKIPYNDIIFGAKDKRKVCEENSIDVMVDDDPKHILNVSQSIPVIIAAQPYNEYLINTPNTYFSRNWIETCDILQNIWKIM